MVWVIRHELQVPVGSRPGARGITNLRAWDHDLHSVSVRDKGRVKLLAGWRKSALKNLRVMLGFWFSASVDYIFQPNYFR